MKEINMKDRKNQTTTNKESNLEADALTDLPVADEQAKQTRAGGFDAQGRLLIGTEGGIWRG